MSGVRDYQRSKVSGMFSWKNILETWKKNLISQQLRRMPSPPGCPLYVESAPVTASLV